MRTDGRTFAIGDIHGCHRALCALLAGLSLKAGDRVVFLGDLVDRGPKSADVVETVLDLVHRGLAICLLGNHEQMLLEAQQTPESLRFWLQIGGTETLRAYQERSGSMAVDPHHLDFFRERCPHYFEDDRCLFAHATVDPTRALKDQSQHDLLWTKWHDQGPHQSGKLVVVGHTTLRDGIPLDVGHTVCIDTYCYGGGWLTAFEVGKDAGKSVFHQANEAGELRILGRSEANRGGAEEDTSFY